jgi:phosphatidylglycerophosphate synthase
MIDRWSLPLIKPALNMTAKALVKLNMQADHITVIGFVFGLFSIAAIAFNLYWLGAALIMVNRVCDGLDGEIARLTKATDRGAYLDIVLDFIFYSGVVFGFALANPSVNALPAAALIFSFMGTGSSFLAFAIFAEKLQLASMTYPSKGFYYLNGITEGTETIAFLMAMCIFPTYFVEIAWVFFTLCIITTVTRVFGGAYTLGKPPEK